ncbi:DAZ protein 1-like [Sycon ciliatum]|uniref:DAZ protein 1-like n=1 Tax=Sycon ciliatum TaxID=27933 RepID=UPI0031F6DCBE
MADSPSPRGSVIPCRVFVGGIAYNTTELELKNFFQSMFGHVKDSKIITDRDGVSKGYGFITFDNQEAADRALETKTLYFEEKKLNIGQAIRKPNSGQFSRPSSPESPLSPIPVAQQTLSSLSSPMTAVAAAAPGFVSGNASGSGSVAYASPQQLTGAAAETAATAQYYYAPQSAAAGIAMDPNVLQPMAIGQQGLYAATAAASQAQQAINMACVNGWYQADARYIMQPQKPAQAAAAATAATAAAQPVQWHHAGATHAMAAAPAQWGRAAPAAYMSAPAQAVYAPTQAAATAASAHAYPIYYQQAEPQWWDPNTGTAMTQQYMPTDVFLDYQHPHSAAVPMHSQQQQQQQHQQPQQAPQMAPQQITYQKAAQPYIQHGGGQAAAAYATPSQTPVATAAAPAYSIQAYSGEEHESHPYRTPQAGHRGAQNGHLLPRPSARNGNSRRDPGRRGRRSSSFRAMRPSTSSSLSSSLGDSAFISGSGGSYDHASLGCDSSLPSLGQVVIGSAAIETPSPSAKAASTGSSSKDSA